MENSATSSKRNLHGQGATNIFCMTREINVFRSLMYARKKLFEFKRFWCEVNKSIGSKLTLEVYRPLISILGE